MLTYSFENKGKDSLYEFLYKSIKNDILSGKLRNGERLPSKRVLSVQLSMGVPPQLESTMPTGTPSWA